MKSNFADALRLVFADEDRFVYNAHDPGGMTNLGVTKATWEQWVKRTVTEQEMRNLTTEMVTPLYKQRYWDAINGDNLPFGVDYCVFDAAVNSGPGTAAKWLQRVCKAYLDGVIGPKTIAAIPNDAIDRFCDLRQNYLESLPTFKVFGRGWTNRVNRVRKAAKDMLWRQTSK